MSTPTSLPIRSLAHRVVSAVTATSLAAAMLLSPSTARADNEVGDVSGTGKGIAGGALLGAEAVVIVESVAGVNNDWAYVIGAVLGAGAGGAGGYAIEQSDSSGKAPVYLLAGGVGLAIPAVIMWLNGVRERPSDGYSSDRIPPNAPPANPGVPGATSVGAPPPAPASAPMGAPSTSTAPRAPLSLVDVNGGTLRMGVPVPEVRPTFTMSEVRQLGVQQQTEVRMPLVKVTF